MRPHRAKYISTVVVLVIAAVLATSSCAGPFSSPGKGSSKVPSPNQKGAKEPTISLYHHDTKNVEQIKMEDYIQGVVAGEMDPSWPVQALAAQAILARTFTLKQIQAGKVQKQNADASTDPLVFQAYDKGKINDKVRKAVAQTRGMAVTQGGKYINAWFCSDAGGRTAASAVEGLDFREEKAPYVHSVRDPGIKISPANDRSWTAVFPLSQVRQKVQNLTGSDPGAITQAKIIKKGPSGRATKIKLGDTTINGPKLRLALGSDVMRSTLLNELKVSGDRLVIKGKGYGHGVGMSQWGAKALADQGKNAQQIVAYYFRNVRVQKIWK